MYCHTRLQNNEKGRGRWGERERDREEREREIFTILMASVISCEEMMNK
jgi:hypothetical protein